MRESLSIWYFSGILLLLYGLLIMGTGIYELWSPPVPQPHLWNLHPAIWWGALMTVCGVFYIARFRPRQRGGR